MAAKNAVKVVGVQATPQGASFALFGPAFHLHKVFENRREMSLILEPINSGLDFDQAYRRIKKHRRSSFHTLYSIQSHSRHPVDRRNWAKN